MSSKERAIKGTKAVKGEYLEAKGEYLVSRPHSNQTLDVSTHSQYERTE